MGLGGSGVGFGRGPGLGFLGGIVDLGWYWSEWGVYMNRFDESIGMDSI
jgi:hypothetical protein